MGFRRNIAAGRARRSTRRLGLWAVMSLVATIVAPAFAAPPALASPEDDLAAKREQAQALEAEIDANGRTISMLDEDYNETRLRIDEAAAGIVEAEARLDAARREANRVRSALHERAAALYVNAGSTGPLDILDASDVHEIGARSKYGAAAAEQDDRLLDELAIVGERLEEQQADLEERRARAEAEKEVLEEKRAEIEQAQAHQQDLLSQVNGEIAQLVREAEERRQREEEARVRAELERQRQAREEAARRATEDESSPRPSRAAPNVPAPNANAQIAVDTAKEQIGKPYRYAASGPDRFDCSGLTMYAWAAAGVSLPHSSRAQFSSLPHVPMEALAPGDLVFYGSPIHHVGIYVGDGVYVHAPQTGDVVKVSSIYRRDFTGAARPG